MAQYKQGLVSVTQGSNIVIGTGTEWLGNVQGGDIFVINGQSLPYFVSSAGSDEIVNLSAPYEGPTLSLVVYGITRDFTPEGMPLMNPQDMGSVAIFNQSMLLLNDVYEGGGIPIGNQTSYGVLKLSNSENSDEGVDDGVASTPLALKSVRLNLESDLSFKMSLFGGNDVTGTQDYNNAPINLVDSPVVTDSNSPFVFGDEPVGGDNGTGLVQINSQLAVNAPIVLKDLTQANPTSQILNLNNVLHWGAYNLPNEILAGTNIQVDNSTPGFPVISGSPSTSAGQLNRVYLTGETEILNGVTYFKTLQNDQGSVASASPTPLVNGNNEKQFYDQDLISTSLPVESIVYVGEYTGYISIKSTPTNGQQQYGVEVYLADALGNPVDSGIPGAVVGNLGFETVVIIDTGLLDLQSGEIEVVQVTGSITEQLVVPPNYHFRYHFWAEKVGTQGGNNTMEIFYGSDHTCYVDAPVITTTSTVLNLSDIVGSTSTDAFNWLLNRTLESIVGSSTEGDILFRGASSWQKLAKGTQGQILAQGAISPFWDDPSEDAYSFDYKATTNTQSPPPNSGRIVWNNVTQTSSTVIYINKTEDGGTDIGNILSSVTIGDSLILFDATDTNNYQRYLINNIVNQTTYIEFEILHDSGAYSFSNNENMVATFLTGGTGGGGGEKVFFKSLYNRAIVNNTNGMSYVYDVQGTNATDGSTMGSGNGIANGELIPLTGAIGRQINEIRLECAQCAVQAGTVGTSVKIRVELHTVGNNIIDDAIFGVVDIVVTNPSEVLTFSNAGGTGVDVFAEKLGITIAIPDGLQWGLVFIPISGTNEEVTVVGRVSYNIRGVQS